MKEVGKGSTLTKRRGCFPLWELSHQINICWEEKPPGNVGVTCRRRHPKGVCCRVRCWKRCRHTLIVRDVFPDKATYFSPYLSLSFDRDCLLVYVFAVYPAHWDMLGYKWCHWSIEYKHKLIFARRWFHCVGDSTLWKPAAVRISSWWNSEDVCCCQPFLALG